MSTYERGEIRENPLGHPYEPMPATADVRDVPCRACGMGPQAEAHSDDRRGDR